MKKFVLSVYIILAMSMFSFAGAIAVTPTPPPSNTTTDVCASGNDMSNVTGIVNWASCFLIKVIVPFLFALALVAFIWGVIQFYLNPDNEEKRKKGKNFIIGGIIALFVMLSVWGLVRILTGTFNLNNTLPQLPGQ